MNHPDKTRLALLAGGDLGFVPALPLRLHVRTCERCQSELQALRRTRQVIVDAAKDMPPGLDWNQLAREMTGNIRVGLAAGECVGGYPVGSRFLRLRWNGALAAAALTGIFVVGFWLNLPAPQANHLLTSLARIVGRDTPEPKASLSYAPSDPNNVVVSVSTRGSAATRSMDDDTGQTTITEVYDAR
jgi:hypothetical protein